MAMIFAWILCLESLFVFSAENAFGGDSPPVLMLDPGHGGSDTGAAASSGLQEKSIVIAFARILKQRLEHRCRVLLTRDDDYELDLNRRAAMGNHEKADLFISLHLGASFLHTPRGTTIFFQDRKGLRDDRFQGSYPADTEPVNMLPRWQDKSRQYKDKSRYFAELLQHRLNPTDGVRTVRIQGAPLFVLAGVDLPAVLVEIGFITNPADAAALEDTVALIRFADAIAQAVEDFFSDDLRL